ncbi:Aldo/keto reductase [Athelia psychrophila]|uniref:Aldo/keto reductase n=1 Tax=Athelia psychrophila TaxID=1759441 RepID=A0A166Q891_9AGAM|nr:Aldo/keto reductase [Fibularhizoctonia sp. CBS 109695]
MSTSTQSQKSMPYVRLGKSGLKVSKIILGCMSYGTPAWESWVLPEEDGIAHIKAALYQTTLYVASSCAGPNLFDQSPSLCSLDALSLRPHSVSKSKRSERYDLMFTCVRCGGKGNGAGEEASTVRLQLEYVDVLQCHRFDNDTPIAETMQALHDVVQAGHARYIGMSSCWAWQFHAMQNYAIAHNLTPFISMQNHYSLAYREEEHEMMPTLKHFGVGSMPWSPLARGLLTRPLGEQAATKRGAVDRIIHRYTQFDGDKEIVNRVEALAKQKNASMAQVALAWVMQRDGVSAPIVGTTSLENLRDLVGAVHLELSAEEVKSLEEMYQPRATNGHT